MALVDFHCHLDLYPDPQLAAERCSSSGAYVLSVTTTPKAWRGTSRLAVGQPRIKTALGLHPELAHERSGELPLFDALLPETRYVGEVGLDGSPWCRPHWREQLRVFEHVLSKASSAGGRILTIHSRRATGAVLDALAKHPGAGVPVLHWFTGSRAELRRGVELGCFFSVNAAMVATKRGRDLVAELPRTRVLTETDGPFCEVDGRPLVPGEVGTTLDSLAALWGLDRRIAEASVLQAFRELLSSGTAGSPA